MRTNLLTYDHPFAGSTTVLVDVPDIPVEISVFDFPGARVGVSLASPVDRNVVQVGPGVPQGAGVTVRAVTSTMQQTRAIAGVMGSYFSQVSSSGGSVLQCAGSLSMGVRKPPMLNLIVPRGSSLDLRGHGAIGNVFYEKRMMRLPLEQARLDDLLDLKFQNEL